MSVAIARKATRASRGTYAERVKAAASVDHVSTPVRVQ